MKYFPMFINLADKKILLVGGGKVGHKKLITLLNYSKNIKIISKEYNKETLNTIENNKLISEKRAFKDEDLKEVDVVVVTTDEEKIQQEIFQKTRGLDILYNCSDNIKYCDFLFPSIIKRGDLSVAVSTSGTSPAFSKQLKEFLENIIPIKVENFLQDLKRERATLKKGNKRQDYFKNRVKKYISSWK